MIKGEVQVVQKKAIKVFKSNPVDMLDVLDKADTRKPPVGSGLLDDLDMSYISPRQKIKKRNLVQFYLILAVLMDDQWNLREDEDDEYKEDWHYIVGNIKSIG